LQKREKKTKKKTVSNHKAAAT